MLPRVNEPPEQAHPVVLFDGVCNFCNASVQWILRRDRAGAFRFASLQSAAAKAELARIGLGDFCADSVVLIEGGRHFLRTDAALRIAKRLGFPWSLFAVFLVVPRFLRDPIYRLIARYRYRWFGKRDSCMVPTPAVRARFLDAGEVS
jgi:predicted DCC family thiol-disulfide oxidoreductase YuxK